MSALKYLITGTSGRETEYAAKLLTSAGVLCTYEKIFNLRYKVDENEITNSIQFFSQEARKPIIAEASWMAAPFIDNSALENTIIIHAVRRPIEVVSFLIKSGFFEGRPVSKSYPYYAFIVEHLPELAKIKGQVLRAVYYYVYWNRKIENALKDRKGIFYQVEMRRKLLDLLGIVVRGKKLYLEVEKNHPVFRMRDIPKSSLKNELLEITERYGYVDKEKKDLQVEPYKRYRDFATSRLTPARITFYRDVLRYIHCEKEDRVLDAGCGPGKLLKLIAQKYKGVKPYAFDGDAHAEQYIREEMRIPKLKFSVGDLRNTGYDDNFFDHVIYIQGFENARKPSEILKELMRITKPGGKILLTIPDGSKDRRRGHFAFWVLSKFINLLRESGYPIGLTTMTFLEAKYKRVLTVTTKEGKPK